MTFCNLISQPMTAFRGFSTCGYNAVQPNTSVFNNAYTNSVTNSYTNVNNTFINQNNANISYNSNITVNNFYNGRNYGFPYGNKVGNFLNQFRQPVVKSGCGCKRTVPQIGCNQRRGVWQTFANTFRNFMNFKYFRFISA